MITFDGVPLENIANIRIDDIRVSPIKYNPVIRPRAIRFGSEFVRMGGGERTVAITFAILDDNRITRHESLMALSKWAKTDREYKLELPTDPSRYLMAVCTAKPEPSTRQWWESKLRLVFTCYSCPYWIGYEKSVSCGTQFNVLGDAPPLMRIERTVSSSAASNQSYSNSDQTMTFSSIPVGDMVIDLNAQTAAVGGTSIMQYYQPSGSFIMPKTGIQTITGTGTVKYRERW
jgi:phage-related protein